MSFAKAKETATVERLSSMELSKTGWSALARRDAYDRLMAMGLPARRDE